MSATTTDNVTQISEEAPKTRSLWSNAFRRLIRNRMSLFSLFIVILVLLLAKQTNTIGLLLPFF